MQDPIADMLTRIRNSQMSKLLCAYVPYSRMKHAILKVLENEGYILGCKILNEGSVQNIKVILKYLNTGKGAIYCIERISRPSKRIYSSIKGLRECNNGLGVYVLSTSRGILSDRRARLSNISGEVICRVF